MLCAKRETRKGAHGCASENLDVVEMGEGLDDEFGGKVLDGGTHVCGAGSWNLGGVGKIRGGESLEIDDGKVWE